MINSCLTVYYKDAKQYISFLILRNEDCLYGRHLILEEKRRAFIVNIKASIYRYVEKYHVHLKSKVYSSMSEEGHQFLTNVNS